MIKEKEEMLKKLQNVEAMERENIQENGLEGKVEIDDVKYLGKATIIQEIEGEKEKIEINIYAVLEDKTIKYYSDDMCLGIETVNVGNGEPAIIPSPEYIRMYEEDNPIKDLITNLKQKEIEEQEKMKDEQTIVSLKELEAEKEKEECEKVLEDDGKETKIIAEIKKKDETKKIERMNHLQEIDADTKVNYYKDMEKTLGLKGVQKFVIVYSEDARQLSEAGEQNSSRYSMIAVMDDSSMLNLSDKLEEVKSEEKNSVEGRIQTDADEKTRVENNPASLYRIKGSTSNETFCFENGQYGEIKAYYGNMTERDGTTFVGTQLETNNVWPTSKEVREQASDRSGQYYSEDKKAETKKHVEHGDEKILIENSDGKPTTVACESPFVPDTNITWEQFSKSIGDKDIEELMKDFFVRYEGHNGQEVILSMQKEHKENIKEKETENKVMDNTTFGEDDDGAGGTKGMVREGLWDSTKH